MVSYSDPMQNHKGGFAKLQIVKLGGDFEL